MSGGVYVYVGKTQSGKTTKALNDLREDIRQTGRPALILDLGPAINFRGSAHESSVRDVLLKLYRDGTHAIYTPKSPEDVDRLFDAISVAGGVNILVDECRWIAHNKYISTSYTKALRHWAHGRSGPVVWRCTSQRPADLHRDFFACLTGELYAFRVDPGPDMDRLVDECGFDPDVLGSLPRGAFLTFSGKWEERGSAPEAVPGAEAPLRDSDEQGAREAVPGPGEEGEKENIESEASGQV